ncbi:MAG: VanW family protein [Deinococcus sp.]|nr:VanW family protein [Deinococcus sp.]
MPVHALLLPALLLALVSCGSPEGGQESAASTPPASAPTAAAGPPAQTTFRLNWETSEPVLVGTEVKQRPVRRSQELPLPSAQPDAAFWEQAEQWFSELERRQPQDVRWTRQGEVWTAQAQHGWQVDREASRASIERALASGRREASPTVLRVAPERTVAWAAQQRLGHLYTGETAFTGSPEFRVHNIRVGADKVSGKWLEPGETFDFNARVGQISAANGFQPGYVITGNTLSMEDGGGLCQVSTTVFRAAFGAGLPITERHAHSYQVAYYGEPGLDAAVYAPSKNLRWINDTGAPLLLQAEWNLDTEQLFIHLFGRDDGREVRISEPQIRGAALPPDPTYVADKALSGDDIKRLDMPAPGGLVTVNREVIVGGKKRQMEMVSRYRPWGGVFAVPPGDLRLAD